MTVKELDIFWSCINCGHIWTSTTSSEPFRLPNAIRAQDTAGDSPTGANVFDGQVQQLRAMLKGVPARLDQLASTLERVPAGVFIVDDERRYIAANDRACALTGYSRPELLQKTIADLTAPNEMVRYERLWDSFIGSTKHHGVYNLVRKDGSLVKVEYRSYADVAPGIHISFIVECA